jgi:hypothetical protein
MSKRSTSGGQRKEGAVAKKIKWLELAVIRSSPGDELFIDPQAIIRSSPSSDSDAECTSGTSTASLT